MGQLQRVFDYEGQQVRTTIIDGQVWFARWTQLGREFLLRLYFGEATA